MHEEENDDAFHVTNVQDWPTVRISIQRAPYVDDEIDTFQTEFISVLRLARDGGDGVPATRLLLLLNLDGIVSATMGQKMRAASFISAVREYVVPSIRATALVVSSSLARMVLQFILMLQPLQSEHCTFTTEAEAASWLASISTTDTGANS